MSFPDSFTDMFYLATRTYILYVAACAVLVAVMKKSLRLDDTAIGKMQTAIMAILKVTMVIAYAIVIYRVI